MDCRKIVFSSLDKQEKGEKSRKKRKANPNNKSAHLIDLAAKAYLHHPSLLPNKELNLLVKASKKANDKGSFLLKRLAEELERREVSDYFLKRHKVEPQSKEIKHKLNMRSPKNPLETGRRLNQTSLSKRETKSKLPVEKIDLHRSSLHRSSLSSKGDSFYEITTANEPLPDPKIKKRDLCISERVYKGFENERSERLVSQKSQKSVNSETSVISKRNISKFMKTFIVNERDEMVSSLLREQGWRKVSLHSDRFCFKWTYNENYRDFDMARNHNKNSKFPHVYLNHIKNNMLVKKDDFHRLTQQMNSKNIKINSFIPHTYLLQDERAEFLSDYEKRVVMILLQKYCRFFGETICGMQDRPRLSIEQAIDFVLSCKQGSIKERFTCHEHLPNCQIPLLFYLIVYACNIWICQEGYDCEPFENSYSRVCSDQTIRAMLIALSQRDLTKVEELQVTMESGFIPNNSLEMPSWEIIDAIFSFHDYFMQKFPDYVSGGSLNLWILKPCSGSKGCGIEIVDKPERINQYLEANGQNKIVQKYIENVWLLNESIVKGNNKLRKSALLNKKFDIRQWALLTQSDCYIFSHFYIKICSKDYDLNKINQQGHLSNYSLNREAFTLEAQSICSEAEFKEVLLELGMQEHFQKLKKSIKEKVALLVNEALQNCDPICGTFELVGFDILLDSELNPWIIECNMSPACAERSEWLKEMKRTMSAGVLEKILEGLFQNPISEEECEWRWEKLRGEWKNQRESPVKEKLEVIGNRIKYKRSKTKKFKRNTLRVSNNYNNDIQ